MMLTTTPAPCTVRTAQERQVLRSLPVVLDARGYRELRRCGLTRADVRRAVDNLKAAGIVTLVPYAGGVIVRRKGGNR